MRADGGSDLPADSPLRQFSYQDSQQQCDNRPVPQLSAAHLHSRNQSDSHVTPDLASASDNEHSPAPAALMVPEHLQLSPTRPALPFPSSSPTYHSSPAHPRIKAPLPNINMAHLSSIPQPMFSPNYPTQPYGNGWDYVGSQAIRQGTQRPRAVSARAAPAAPVAHMYQPTAMTQETRDAPANSAIGVNELEGLDMTGHHATVPNMMMNNMGHLSHGMNHNSQMLSAQFGFGNFWQNPSPEIDTFSFNEQNLESPHVQQLRNLVTTSQALHHVVENDQPPYPPHEVSSPPPTTPHRNGDGMQSMQIEVTTPATFIASSPPTGDKGWGMTKPRYNSPARPKKTRGRPRKDQMESRKSSTKLKKSSRISSIASAVQQASQTQDDVLDIPSSPSAPAATGYDSNDDADGETDGEYFDEAGYHVANGVAMKAPRQKQSNVKLKINPPAASGSTSKAAIAARMPNDTQSRGRPRKPAGECLPKSKNKKPGPYARAAAKQEAALKQVFDSIPDTLKNKEHPEDVNDLLALVEFETGNYNRNPMREVELEGVNEQIRRENEKVEQKVRRVRENLEPKKNPSPRKLYERKVKRKMDGEDSATESVISTGRGRRPKVKARKREKAGSEVVPDRAVPRMSSVAPSMAGSTSGEHVMGGAVSAPNELPSDAADATFHPGSPISSHDEPFSEPDGDDLGPAALSDFWSQVPLSPIRKLMPAPGSFIFDDQGNAIPNPQYRRGSGRAMAKCPAEEKEAMPDKARTRNAEATREQREKSLELLMKIPRKEAVRFLPMKMGFLKSRVEKMGLGGHAELRNEGQARGTDGDGDVVMGDLCEGEMVQERPDNGKSNPEEPIPVGGAAAGCTDVGSDMDADGETDDE